MTRILVTGARGFIGRNLLARLSARDDLEVLPFDLENSDAELDAAMSEADVVVHLAGVNRPENPDEFETGNTGFTQRLCDGLAARENPPKIVLTSSIQATADNPYGRSKRGAEQALEAYASERGGVARIYRLKNVFGKWCRPNYNSVTATFCHNIAHDLPVTISDPGHEIELVYIDDVVDALVAEACDPRNPFDGVYARDTMPSHTITLGELAGRIQAFHEMRNSLITPDFAVSFNQRLYATFLTYRPTAHRAYGLDVKTDPRGSLAEFIKSKHFGQIFVSRTRPGVTRGNHYHHTKTEKFLVLEGTGLIRTRPIDGDEVDSMEVSGMAWTVVDIPPGLTHSITNTGDSDLVTLFWASELFDPDRPDTYYLEV